MPQNSLHLFENIGVLNKELLLPKSPGLSQVVAQRTIPGILIFAANDQLVYMNAEAREILSSTIPETVSNLCSQLKLMVSSYKFNPSGTEHQRTPSALALSTCGSEAYSFRAFLLSDHQNNGDHGESYILILIERISHCKKINIHKALQQYQLSKREVEVVEFLLLGHKNKEIAQKLYVCVYTIEDHLKKIMKKMQVSSRTGIIAKLLEVQ